MSKFQQNYELTKTLALTEFKLRYHGSLLGYLWTLIKPLMLFGVLYVVFSILMRFPVEHYQIYLLLGIILWNFFAEGTSMGLASLLSKSSLISKVNFPRILIVVASTSSALITFALNFLIFIVFLILSDIPFSISMLFFPIYVIAEYFIILGISLLLSVLFIRFRDMSHIWEILLQLGFWLTPIFYTIEIVPTQYHSIFYLNPMARIIWYSRTIFLQEHIPGFWLNAVIIIFAILIFIFGYMIFKWLNKNIVEKL
ncbi:MAG: ABC transporter permease [Candidatus Gracilibacteria bacterium]|nr:ABC transporter permease [Candidatus Gracilibacteria bacterium]